MRCISQCLIEYAGVMYGYLSKGSGNLEKQVHFKHFHVGFNIGH